MGGSDPSLTILAFCSGRGGRDINALECLGKREIERNKRGFINVIIGIRQKSLLGLEDMLITLIMSVIY